MQGRFRQWWSAAVLAVLLVCLAAPAWSAPPESRPQHEADLSAPAAARLLLARMESDDDDPLESDDDDLLDEPLDLPPAPKFKTILLDIEPVDMDEKLAARVYVRVFEVLQQAEDLGDVIGREAFGKGQLYRHLVRTCQDIENIGCLGRFAEKTKATMAVFGQIQDMDDLTVLTLYLMDVKTHQIRESVRTPIPKPASDQEIIENAAIAACRLVRHYGCGTPAQPAALAVVPVPAPAARAQAPEPLSDDADLDEAETDEDEDDLDDEDEEDSPIVAAAKPAKATKSYSDRQKTFIITGWTFVALSAASLAGGAATTALMVQAVDEYNAAQPGEGQKARDARSRAETMQWTSLGLYSAAGACAAVGIPLLVLGYQDDPETATSLLPVVAPDGFGLVLTSRF
jgi:hypothetical protein